MAGHEGADATTVAAALDASGRNVQSDGKSGPASDDASARASGASGASGDQSDRLSVRVDQDKCTGDGLCVQYAPTVFEFDIDGLAYVKDGDDLLTAPGATTAVPESLRIAVIDAADECPGDCIYVTGADGSSVAGPDS